MGLDMYLYLRKSDYHCGGSWHTDEEREKAKYPKELASFEEEIKRVNFPSVSIDIDYQVGYWRKANAIHSWFIENCADGVDKCQDIYVSQKKAQALLDKCNEVIADHSLAEKELPTQDGFFFGSTKYDEYYYEDIVYTKEILEKVIAFVESEEGKYYHIIYHASW